jgi:hypothetical protein
VSVRIFRKAVPDSCTVHADWRFGGEPEGGPTSENGVKRWKSPRNALADVFARVEGSTRRRQS